MRRLRGWIAAMACMTLNAFATPQPVDMTGLWLRGDESGWGLYLAHQGDTGLRCKSLVVFYEQSGQPTDASKTLQAASPGPGGEQRIKRLEARGGVVVTQKDQTATGELGIFDMKANTVTLTGNPVIMTQGQNVLRGGKLVVDLTSGVSRVEAGKSGQGVQMLVQPGASTPDSKSGSADGQAPRPIPVRPFN